MDELPEVSPLSPPERPPNETRSGRLQVVHRLFSGRRVRLAITTVVLVGAVVALLLQAMPALPQRVSALHFPSPARTSTPGAPPAGPQQPVLLDPSLTPIPRVTGGLAPPPTNCPASPPLDTMTAQPSGFIQPVTLHGRAPIWLPEGYGYPPGGSIVLGQLGVLYPYPTAQVIWEIGPSQYPPFTAQVKDIATGEPAWWDTGGSTVAPVLSVDPNSALTPPAFSGWVMGLIFTHAGCYELEVTWNGGGWSSIFAVGGAPS